MSKKPLKMGMRPSHPGAIIRDEVLTPLKLSVTRAAEVLDVRRATLSDLVNEKAALSPEMALRLEKVFGVNLDMMLRIQAAYDSYHMRQMAAELPLKRFQPA